MSVKPAVVACVVFHWFDLRIASKRLCCLWSIVWTSGGKAACCAGDKRSNAAAPGVGTGMAGGLPYVI